MTSLQMSSQHKPTELDRIAFSVPAQRFRISATIARDAPVSLVTEYVLRLVHVLGEVTPSGVQTYFGISDFEATALIKDLVRDTFLTESNGSLILGARGKDAFRYGSPDDPRVSDLAQITRSVAFDRIAFAPVDDTAVSPRPAVISISSDDPTKAESSREQAEAAFQLHFREIDERYAVEAGNSKRPSIQSVDAVRQERHFSFEVVIPLNLAESGVVAAEPDFSEIYGDDYTKSPLVAALARACSAVRVPNDSEDALNLIAAFDKGLISKVRSRDRGLDVEAWFNRILNTAPASLPIPALPFVGAPNTMKVKQLLREAFDLAEHQGLAFSGSVIWLRPEVESWGRSYEFASFLKELTNLWGLTDAPTLLSSGETYLQGSIGQFFQESFSRCVVAPAGTFPAALELIVAPGRWIIAIVYQRVDGFDYAVPCGFFVPIASVASQVASLIRETLLNARSGLKMRWRPDGENSTMEEVIASLTTVSKVS
jgi:hypothetical protein